MEGIIYLEEDKTSAPGVLTAIPESVPYGTEFTSNLIIERLTPFIMQNLNNMMDKKFNELYMYLEMYFEQLSSEISNIIPEVELEEPNVVIIEEMTRKQAKDKITKFFENYDGEIYPSEISEQLHISYELVWEILKELHEDGIIKTEA